MSTTQAAQFMKRADSSEGSTVCFGSPTGHKLSWADLCDDSDDDSWEGEVPPRREPDEEVARTTEQQLTAGRAVPPAARGLKSVGRAGQHHPPQSPQPQKQKAQHQQQTPEPRGSPKGGRSSGNRAARGNARRSPAGTPAPKMLPPSMLGCGMPPPGCNPMDSYTVELAGVPVNLCNDVCLDAMLHQAGLYGAVTNCDIQSSQAGGTAKITLMHWQAAVMCYHHFSTSRWASGSLKVVMHLPNNTELSPESWIEQQQPEKSETPTSREVRRRGGAWAKSQQGKTDNIVAGFVCVPVQYCPEGHGSWQALMPCA